MFAVVDMAQIVHQVDESPTGVADLADVAALAAVARMRCTGTHPGEWHGVAPNGRRLFLAEQSPEDLLDVAVCLGSTTAGVTPSRQRRRDLRLDSHSRRDASDDGARPDGRSSGSKHRPRTPFEPTTKPRRHR